MSRVTLIEDSLTNRRGKQIFYDLFNDKTNRLIFSILRKGAIEKEVLKNRLQTEYEKVVVNLELLLTPFFQLNLLKNETIFEKEVLALVNDAFCARVPPREILQNITTSYFS